MSDIINELYGTTGDSLAKEFAEQIDAYYSSPTASFHDNNIAKKFYEQRLKYLEYKPYPNDELVTFGASGTNMCDRQIVFKNAKVKTEKTPDIPFRARQRRVGSAVIEYFQLDLAHMEKRLGKDAKFTLMKTRTGEWAMEDAAQVRKVFDHNGVKFAITVKPDGILEHDHNKRYILEYKTKASGVVEMNGKLDFSGAQDDHLRQVTAEAIVYGINEGFLVYESMHKPSWFSDEDKKSVPKTRKTWADGEPKPDLRVMYFRITDEMKTALLDDLAKQSQLVYDSEVSTITFDMTQKCGFCAFKTHCQTSLSAEETTFLREVDANMAKSSMGGKYQHNNLRNYLAGLNENGGGQ